MRCSKVRRGKRKRARASLAACRIRVPVSSGLAHLVGALAVADHQDIEDALIDAVDVPQEARSISVSLDRVSVPMEEPRRRPAGRPKKGAPISSKSPADLFVEEETTAWHLQMSW